MANIHFIGDAIAESGFFLGMRNEIIRTVNDPDKMFDHFRGTFEIKLDKERPKAEYHKDPDEDLDDGLLKSYLFLLNYTMITFTLKNRQRM